jgi:outer membrane protein OmpA-like peptidoglycan-associated protein/tetratricopeptide (TPR) repeat protein
MWLKKYLSVFLFIVLVATTATAQKGKLKRAQKHAENREYKAAIEIYLQILDKSDDSDAKIGIADCYRHLNNCNEMEYWYGQVVLLPSADVSAWLYYAKALHCTGNNKGAKKAVQTYLKQDPASPQAQFLLKALEEDVVQNLRASGALYTVEPVKEANTAADEFCPILYKDQQLIYVSDREDKKEPVLRTDSREGKPFTALYSSEVKLLDEKEMKYSYAKSKKFSKTLNSKYYDGPVTFSADGSEAYFSRTSMDGRSDDGVWRVKIYRALGSDQNWDKPQGVPFNSDEYSVYHPSLSEKGDMLFFAANMPGGFGGMDLYVSYMEEGRWSPPINLGPEVNTDGDELFPFIHPDGTLYFASNGLIGLGGYDIYMSKESFGTWTAPTNLGYPINTLADDFGMTMNKAKTHGYFASNREGGAGGDDIYSFKKLSVEVEVIVIDSITGMPIEGAEIFTPCSAVKSFTTNADGKVFLEIGLDKACDFAAEKTPYKPNARRKSTKDLKAGELMVVQIPLVLECFINLKGNIFDGYTKEPIEGVLITLTSNCGAGLDSSTTTTNAEGNYQFDALPEDCDFILKVNKIGYTGNVIPFSTNNCASDTIIPIPINCFGPDCKNKPAPNPNCIDCPKPIPTDTSDCVWVTDKDNNRFYVCTQDTIFGITPNGDTIRYYPDNPILGPKELVHIFYDYDDASLRPDAQPALDKLLKFLNDYPGAKILITSHTDARGSSGYNNRLSSRRADSVVRFLISNGISKKRLKTKGMGEEVMLNECYDGVECDETQHQENRRTEFQVYEFDDEGGEIKSRRPDKVKVNPCRNCPKTAPVEGDGAPKDNSFDPNPPFESDPTPEEKKDSLPTPKENIDEN